MKQISIFITLVLLLTACSHHESLPLTHKVSNTCTYYSIKSATCLNAKRYIESIEPYQVIFVGDHHDSAAAHQVMVETIKGLSKAGYRVSVANEWFTPQDNKMLENYVAGKLDHNSSKALKWKQRAGYDFNLTQPIYDAVIKEEGSLYGINMDKAFKKKISHQQLSEMSSEEKKFYDALDLNVTAHQQLLAPFFDHCHHIQKGESARACSERMYRVQVAWDSMMGEESAKLASRLEKNERLIVFIGAMHLESALGANLRFARQSHIPFITILPYKIEQNVPYQTLDHGSADIIYLYR